jgi:flavin-dependent dehydrogenase
VLPNAPISTARLLEVITPVRRIDNPPHEDAEAYFDFFPVPKGIAGYVWDFPTQIKGQPMRCWGVYDANLLAGEKRPALKQPLAEEMARHGFDLGEYELKGFPIRWFDPFHPLSTPRALLVGDAAGADPIFGEGISIALGYGAVAATEIGRAFQRGDFSFSGYRRRALMGGLGQTLVTRWIVAQIIYPIKWKWFQVLLWRWLKPVVSLLAWVFVLNWSKRL